MSTAPASAAAPGLPLPAPASTLALGQIVKARVLRHYEGGRYLVSLDGRERVVDSSVPLSAGELIRGRVVAVGERVELEPLRELPGGVDAEATAPSPPVVPGDELGAAFAQAGLPLDDATRAVVTRSLKTAADPQAALFAAMTLAKLGLPQAAPLLDAVQALLRRRPAADPGLDAGKAAFSVATGAQLVSELREALRSALAPSDPRPADAAPLPLATTTAGADDRRSAGQDSGGDAAFERQLGQWVMNAQTGGAVSHRVGTLPLLVAGRLVEVDVALFEQQARQQRQGESRARRVVFVLDSAALGGVEVSARVVDSRLRLRFAAERGETLERLAAGRDALAARLGELGWTVDEIAYEPRGAAPHNAAYRAVADYVVTQGSLDRKF